MRYEGENMNIEDAFKGEWEQPDLTKGCREPNLLSFIVQLRDAFLQKSVRSLWVVESPDGLWNGKVEPTSGYWGFLHRPSIYYENLGDQTSIRENIHMRIGFCRYAPQNVVTKIHDAITRGIPSTCQLEESREGEFRDLTHVNLLYQIIKQ